MPVFEGYIRSKKKPHQFLGEVFNEVYYPISSDNTLV